MEIPPERQLERLNDWNELLSKFINLSEEDNMGISINAIKPEHLNSKSRMKVKTKKNLKNNCAGSVNTISDIQQRPKQMQHIKPKHKTKKIFWRIAKKRKKKNLTQKKVKEVSNKFYISDEFYKEGTCNDESNIFYSKSNNECDNISNIGVDLFFPCIKEVTANTININETTEQLDTNTKCIFNDGNKQTAKIEDNEDSKYFEEFEDLIFPPLKDIAESDSKIQTSIDKLDITNQKGKKKSNYNEKLNKDDDRIIHINKNHSIFDYLINERQENKTLNFKYNTKNPKKPPKYYENINVNESDDFPLHTTRHNKKRSVLILNDLLSFENKNESEMLVAKQYKKYFQSPINNYETPEMLGINTSNMHFTHETERTKTKHFEDENVLFNKLINKQNSNEPLTVLQTKSSKKRNNLQTNYNENHKPHKDTSNIIEPKIKNITETLENVIMFVNNKSINKISIKYSSNYRKQQNEMPINKQNKLLNNSLKQNHKTARKSDNCLKTLLRSNKNQKRKGSDATVVSSTPLTNKKKKWDSMDISVIDCVQEDEFVKKVKKTVKRINFSSHLNLIKTDLQNNRNTEKKQSHLSITKDKQSMKQQQLQDTVEENNSEKDSGENSDYQFTDNIF